MFNIVMTCKILIEHVHIFSVNDFLVDHEIKPKRHSSNLIICNSSLLLLEKSQLVSKRLFSFNKLRVFIWRIKLTDETCQITGWCSGDTWFATLCRNTLVFSSITNWQIGLFYSSYLLFKLIFWYLMLSPPPIKHRTLIYFSPSRFFCYFFLFVPIYFWKWDKKIPFIFVIMMSRINPKTYIASVCDIFISLTRKRNHKSELLISDNLSQFFAIVKIQNTQNKIALMLNQNEKTQKWTGLIGIHM